MTVEKGRLAWISRDFLVEGIFVRSGSALRTSSLKVREVLSDRSGRPREVSTFELV